MSCKVFNGLRRLFICMGRTQLVIACMLMCHVQLAHAGPHGCPAGQFWHSFYGMCVDCMQEDTCQFNEYCPGDDNGYYCSCSCTSTQYVSSVCTAAANRVCVECSSVSCAAGTKQTGLCGGTDPGTCTPCLAGSSYPSARTRQIGLNGCTYCTYGTYQPASGQPSCISCAAGTYNNVNNAYTTACKTCASGTFSGTGKSSCTSCAIGGWSDAGASACTYCPNGQAPVSTGSRTCVACAAGSYSQGGAPCVSCSSGTYAQGTGNAACLTCGAGNYGNTTSCSPCYAGTYLLQVRRPLHARVFNTIPM